MVDLLQWGAVVAALSALPLIVLGLLLFLIRPRRTSTVAFALFLILWGIHVLLGNGSRLALLDGDTGTARLLILLFVALTLVLYIPLTYFAAVFPTKRAFFARSSLGQVLLLAPAAVGALAFATRPAFFFRGFVGDTHPRSDWGFLFWLFVTLLFVAFLYAAVTLHRHLSRTTRRIERRRTLYILLALVVYLAYWVGETLVDSAMRTASGAATLPNLLFAATAAVVGAVLAWNMSGLLRDGEWRRSPGAALITVAHAVPFIIGAVAGASYNITMLPSLPFSGIWRILAAGLLTYAILRWQLFDLDRRVKSGTVGVLLVLGIVGTTVGLELVLERIFGSTRVALVATQALLVGAVVLALVFLPTTVRWMSERLLPALDATWRLDKRRLEVYEAALVHALADEREMPRAVLGSLRDRLGISANEGAILERLVRGDADAAEGPPRRGTLVSGRYRLEERLGEGVFGAAWLAHDTTLDRRVVLKVRRGTLGEDGLREFLREARTAARLEHPHVVRVYDFGYLGGAPFIVTEYCDGGSLAEILARGEPLDAEVSAAIMQDVLDGLACIHLRGIVHRDLKPANILFGRDGVAKIGDFGLAVGVEPTATQVGLDEPAVVGTPAYMPPEAAMGLAPSPAGDLYAAGAILFHMLTAETHLDLEGKDAFAVRAAIMDATPRDPPRPLGPAWTAVLRRALARDPTERFPDAEAMQDAVAAAAAEPTPPAEHATKRPGKSGASRSQAGAPPAGA